MIDIKEVERFVEIDILLDGKKIGQASIDISKKYLSCFEIYEPFQNNGFGQEALAKIIDKYGILYLSVKKDNERAIHIYEKLKFRISDRGIFYAMERQTVG